MTVQTRLGIFALMLTAGFGLLNLHATQGDEPKPIAVNKDMRTNIKNIAALLKAGNTAAARKLAGQAGAQVDELSDLMHLYRIRKGGGLGWGPMVQANGAQDGIERQLRIFEKAVPENARQQSENYETAGYWIAAMAEVTLAKGHPKKKGWPEHAERLREAGIEFAKASNAKDLAEIAQAAEKVTSACAACHSVFKAK